MCKITTRNIHTSSDVTRQRSRLKKGCSYSISKFQHIWSHPHKAFITHAILALCNILKWKVTTISLPCVPLALSPGLWGWEPGYKTRVLCATNNIVSSGTCFAWRMSDTTGWVVGRAVQVTRDIYDGWELHWCSWWYYNGIHCFSPISCLTSAILSRPCSISLLLVTKREKGSGRNGS